MVSILKQTEEIIELLEVRWRDGVHILVLDLIQDIKVLYFWNWSFLNLLLSCVNF